MNENEKTFDMSSSPEVSTGTYYPFSFENSFYKPNICRDVTTKILNQVFKQQYSISKWRKLKYFSFTGKNTKNEDINGKISYDILEKHLNSNRSYNADDLKFLPLITTWLDSTISLQLNFYAPSNDSEESLTIKLSTENNHNYPQYPNIDREGFAYSTMLTTLENILFSTRNDLVNKSNLMLEPDNHYWIEKLMTFLNTSISLIDSMLIMIYYKAKHDPDKFGWKFDNVKLGTTVSRRISDKIHWVHSITNKHLPDITEELAALNELKTVRNHLNHFDPPVFACTIEDAARWLNSSFQIGMLALKIRETANSSISNNLIKLLLSKPIKFNPKDPGKKRFPQTKSGYISCFE